jgi:hypothetical protein
MRFQENAVRIGLDQQAPRKPPLKGGERDLLHQVEHPRQQLGVVVEHEAPKRVALTHQLSEGVGRESGQLGPGFGDAMGRNRFDGFTTAGVLGQFGVGVLLGAVWSPCVGPTLGAASLLASQGRDLGVVALTMLLFGFGAALPLLLLATCRARR